MDSVLCHEPQAMNDRDLRHVPYELFHTCMSTSYSYLFANIQHMERQQRLLRGVPHPSLDAPLDQEPECEPKPKPRPINLRHAIATVIITGIVCGVVCLMMLAAAVYGCTYAAIMAKYQRELKKREDETGRIAKENTDRERAKELLDNAIA